MNKLSDKTIQNILELGKQQKFSIKEISKILNVSQKTIFTYLKSSNIPCLSQYESHKLHILNQINKLYSSNKSLSQLFIKFNRHIDLVLKFINTLNLKISDAIVIDIFSDKSLGFSKSRYISMKKHIDSNKAFDFEKNLIRYFDNRFNDSKSISETYARIKYKIFERPCCEECNKDVMYNGNIEYGLFNRFCSKKCSNNNELTKARLRAHNIEVYGVPVTSQAQCVKDKAKKHFCEKYGVDNPWKAKEVKDIARQTKLQKYGDENYNNREKAELTCLDRYGVRVSSQNAEIQQKASIAYHLVVFEKFGTEWPMQNETVKAKFKNTMMSNYGSTSYLSSEDYKKKCIELYGVENPIQCKKIMDKTRQNYIFNEISFDSAPEIAFFIWLKDNNIQFEYQPNVSFEYMHNGKTHKYFPDFKIGDLFFEVKGDHFFKNGKMICPFRKKTWTDNEYADVCARYEAKHQCMLKHDIIILKNNEYQIFMAYIHKTYGKDFLKQFKIMLVNS